MANADIRQAAKSAGVKLWRVAENMGLADSGLSRKLRHELPEEEKARILGIIEKLKEGRK